MRKGLLIRIFVVCLLCVPYASVGQHLAKIFGKVTDENELPIEAANIIVLQEDHIGTSTNEAGRNAGLFVLTYSETCSRIS